MRDRIEYQNSLKKIVELINFALDDYLNKISYQIKNSSVLGATTKEFADKKYAVLYFENSRYIVVADRFRNCELTARRIKNLLQSKEKLASVLLNYVTQENYSYLIEETRTVLQHALDVNKTLSAKYNLNWTFVSNKMLGRNLFSSFFHTSINSSRAEAAISNALLILDKYCSEANITPNHAYS